MATTPIRSTGHPRGQSQSPAGDSYSDVSRSQQRVRDWIQMTEDNVTSSSGVSETSGTVNNSPIEDANLRSPRDADQNPDLPTLNQDSWDRFQTVPRDEHWNETRFTSLLRCVKVLWILLLFLVVLGAGVTNRLSLLTLTSSIVKGGDIAASSPTATMLVIAVCFPYLCHFLTYSVRSMFGATHWPSLRLTVAILFLELCHTTGMCFLLFRVLPHVDMMRGLGLLTSVYVIPSILNVITTATNNMTSGCKRFLLTSLAMVTFLIQAGGVGLATYQGFTYNGTEAQRLREEAASSGTGPADVDEGLGVERSPVVAGQDLGFELPLSLVLISFGFWENFIDGEFRLCGLKINMHTWKGRLSLVRQRIYVLVSVFKMSATILLAVLLVPGFNFTLTFAPDVIAALTSPGESESDPEVHVRMYGPLYAMLVSGMVCSYMSGLACKLCVQVMGFALPLSLVTPLSLTVLMLECQHPFLRLPPPSHSFYTWVCPPVTLPSPPEDSGDAGWLHGWTLAWWFRGGGFYQHVVLLGVLWLSQLVLTSHVWRPTCSRMEKIQNLFITPMRCGVLTEQTLMARRRITYTRTFQNHDGEGTSHTEDMSGPADSVPLIYACATMWHETQEEMVQLMKSIFRMDIDRSARFIAQKYYKIKDPEYYDFEAHIFFDDAMKLSEDLRHIPNNFVADFMNSLDDAISAVHERPTSLGDPVRTPTPYGGRLTWILPGGTPLVVHLKDKNKIRHKKRWSQVMYMYYLLGFKILANSDVQADQEPEIDSASDVAKKRATSGITGRAKLTSSELRRRRAASHFTRSIIFNYVPEEIQFQAENTYVLALDGDVDFKPEAVRLLLDRMKKNTKVGAACGRIHPTGSGPLVWYQKFEYAIGHWLQKATEHVFGCVLCAPGCFSLFRGSALMDDNVVKRYAMKSSQASHYVQYDQGEDRWLSTLLLQQGYRIDYTAAADALTHAPEFFSEFFNQRRRWGPSTLANLMDLLGDWRNSVHLNDNLSTVYMFYQCMMLVSTVLGPATIVLLMAGSFRVVFKISVVESYTLTLMVPAAYLALCMYARPALQLQVGAFLSALYALVMTIVLVGTVGTAIDGSITSPNVLFLFTIILIFTVSGFMHPRELYCILPGILYLIMIPAGYLILTIYFLCNLHVVSWGTRETQASSNPSKQQQLQQQQQESATKIEENKDSGVLGWLGAHRLARKMCKVLRQLQETFTTHNRANQDQTQSTHTDLLLQELIVELRRERGCAAVADNAQDQIHAPIPPSQDPAVIPSSSSRERTTTRAAPKDRSERPSRAARRSATSQRAESEMSEADDQRTLATSLGLPLPEEPDGEQVPSAGVQDANSNNSPGFMSRALSDVDLSVRASWLTSEVCGDGPVTELTPREETFWRQMIGTYLYPLNEDRRHLEKMNEDLINLRNVVVFGFFMSSAIWVALTMQLEVLQNDLEAYLFIHITRFNDSPDKPPLRFQPLGLFFLGSFAFILLTQFVGMFAHRWGTFLHTLAITDVGVGTGQDSEHSRASEAIHRVIELQRLRNIELEPEPDYDEPLPDYGNDNDNDNNSVINPVFVPDIADGENGNAENHSQIPDTSNARRPDDDAFSLASRMGTSAYRGQGSYFQVPASRPYPHASLVPPVESSVRAYDRRGDLPFQHAGPAPPGEDWRSYGSRMPARPVPSSGVGGRGPLGNFTLQRAFERRFRNEMGLGVNGLQSNSLFQAPPPYPFVGGRRVSHLDGANNV